jgi:outer membrane immunogenic protein
VNDRSAFVVRNSIFEPIVGGFTTLSKASTNGGSYGWFVGYNQYWEGVLLGLEANYNHTALNTGASDSVSVRIANDATAPTGHHFIYDPFTVSGNASIRITDVGSFRARAGWVAGQFVPYAFVGLAVARADVTRSATVAYLRTDVPDTTTFPNPPITPIPPSTFGPATQSDNRQGGFYFGYAIGLGLEICIMPNVFIRGEWEIDNFQSLHANINTGRMAFGLKF